MNIYVHLKLHSYSMKDSLCFNQLYVIDAYVHQLHANCNRRIFMLWSSLKAEAQLIANVIQRFYRTHKVDITLH